MRVSAASNIRYGIHIGRTCWREGYRPALFYRFLGSVYGYGSLISQAADRSYTHALRQAGRK